MATNDTILGGVSEPGEDTNISQSNEDSTQDEKKEEETSIKGAKEEDEDLEEGELKDDDDDDDDEDDDDNSDINNDLEKGGSKRIANYNNDDNNNGGFSKESTFNENRHDMHYHNQPPHSHHHSFPPHHGPSGQQPSPSIYPQHHPANRRMSPNSLHQAEMHGQYPANHQHFANNSNNNHYRYPPNEVPPIQLMGHPQPGGPGPTVYARGGGGGGPGGVGPMHKVNIRCRFYSKTSNKCTWGDHCRFEHRDDSPGSEADGRGPPSGSGPSPGPGRGPPPPMSAAERGPYPPYPGRHQPYLPAPPHGYPYDVYGHHHSTPPPLPPHSMSHWRPLHSPYPPPSGGHPPKSISPSSLSTSGGPVPASANRGSSAQASSQPSSGIGSGSSASATEGPSSVSAQHPGGVSSPSSYQQSSSSAVVYERKSRLAYEMAPWNERSYQPANRYERGDPSAGIPPGGRGPFHRNHHSRELPYGRELPPHMGGGHPGYPAYPSAYRNAPVGPHASHYKYMTSSQRNVPPDSRRSRSNKRGHDDDESSWSDTGSEDSILGQANYANKNHANKAHKQPALDNANSDEPLDQGSGTPPGEPLPEDKERQEMLLNKLKEIEDLMAKKKGEQEDPL